MQRYYVTVINDEDGVITGYFKNTVASCMSLTHFGNDEIITYEFNSIHQAEEFISLMRTTIAEEWQPLTRRFI